MSITYSELSNKTAPNGANYKYAYTCYDTSVVYDGDNQLHLSNVPSGTSGEVYFKPQVYYSLDGQYLHGTIYFRMKNKSNGSYSAGGVSYLLNINCYNSSKQLVQILTLVPEKGLYKTRYTGYSSQWASGKMYNWNMSSTNLTKLRNTSYNLNTSYSDLSAQCTAAGCKSYSGGWIQLEPFLIRYASDTESVHYNMFNKYINTPSKINVSNCESYRSAPANAGCQDFSTNVSSNTSFISFTLTVITHNTSGGESGRSSVTFPDYSGGYIPAEINSHIYRYNGSSWNRVGTVNYFTGSEWKKVKVYRYNGSSWVQIPN